MSWRVWATERLRTYGGLTALVPPKAVISVGALTGRPNSIPFIVMDFGHELPGPFPGAYELDIDLHVHNEPGDYLVVDNILRQARLALMGGEDVQAGRVVSLNGIAIKWNGNSRDFPDDDLKTIYKTASFTLRSVKANA